MKRIVKTIICLAAAATLIFSGTTSYAASVNTTMVKAEKKHKLKAVNDLADGSYEVNYFPYFQGTKQKAKGKIKIAKGYLCLYNCEVFHYDHNEDWSETKNVTDKKKGYYKIPLSDDVKIMYSGGDSYCEITSKEIKELFYDKIAGLGLTFEIKDGEIVLINECS